MKTEGKPKQVQEARYHDDRKALSAMGRKGARIAAENRELQKIRKQKIVEEVAAEQAKFLTLSPEGDVLPPDQNIIEDFKNQ